LNIGGTTEIGSYAFDGLESLENLYIPVGTTLNEYSFNGNSSIKKLEADVSLPAHSFENCGAIETLILDSNVVSLSYDWEGHSSSVSSRTVYIKNDTMFIEYYGNEGLYYSALGSSGDIIVYVPATSSVDLGNSVTASQNGVLTLNGYTSYAHSGNYSSYIKGLASSVTIRAKQNIDTQMENDGVASLKDSQSVKVQTGIDAYYTGTILTTKDIDKTNMTVTRVYNSDDGETYNTSEFYVVRTTEFNTEARKQGGVTEEAIASYEPVHAGEDDLDLGATTGTISVTVVVFYDYESEDETIRKYYSTPVSIRVEEYSSKNYIEQVYGSYDAIVDRLAQLDKQIDDLKNELENADADSVEDLISEINQYKVAYTELVGTLNQYVEDNQSTDGYFGTSEGKDVIYIEGNPTEYIKTDFTDKEGNIIYKVAYDTDGDGEPENVFVLVKADGVYVVDSDGNLLQDADGDDLIYKDTLGALERQAAAQLASIKASLAECDEGVASIKNALENGGFEFDTSEDADDEYTQIANAIKGLYDDIEDLTDNLEAANTQIDNYASALETIYTKLTGSTLKADEISGLANVLSAITGKIQILQNELTAASATLTSLQTQLSDAESNVAQLQADLDSAKNDLSDAEATIEKYKTDLKKLEEDYAAALANGDKDVADKIQEQIDAKNAALAELENAKATLEQKENALNEAQETVEQLKTQIADKNAEIANLQAKLDALSDTAEGFTMTVDTANKLFGLELSNGTSNDDVYSAIQDYVAVKILADETISKIQKLVNSNNTGDALVEDVREAIGSSNNTDNEQENVVNTDSENYKAGYAAGAASVDVSENSTPYKSGYAAGLVAGQQSGSASSMSTTSYQSGYTAGYSAGAASLDTSSYYSNGYNSGYSAGYKAGQSATDTTSLNKQITTLSSENAELKNQISELEKQVQESASTGAVANNTATTSTTATTTSSTSTGATAKASTSTARTFATTGAESTAKTVAISNTETTDEDVDMEGSTSNIVAGSTISGIYSSDSKKTIGEHIEINLPTSTSKSDKQKAETVLNRLDSEDIDDIFTNAQSFVKSSTEQENNALKIVSWYMNNLESLSLLGDTEIDDAYLDETKTITFDEIISIDVTPSDSQLELINSGDNVQLSISSEKIDDGALYLVVHESDSRVGVFDVLLARAENGAVEIQIPDLSPITVVKVDVSEDIAEIFEEETVTEEPSSEEETPQSLEETKTESNTATSIISVILIILVIGALGFLGVMFYKKKQNIN
jgi:predicted  nucleic acid-binding Zn-ribbon protein